MLFRSIDDVDGTIDAGAESARRGEKQCVLGHGHGGVAGVNGPLPLNVTDTTQGRNWRGIVEELWRR